ncbi:hypothetical protein MPTK1_5g11520 [Marchantia polymorpha subsp. ruderalis]|uniref:Uncharacterized protein n=2 Tax=Marchantia polymorpha TaxID=3197 RepID=A0AAF6BHB0_MARPO|nr:hypothetical protein MARPO_0093s0075 [Marchantia polymorpha]BBN11394.1 hypothetical protein Mp_5g11520 [Marchantia polymorpha subsp. ruderalis]|eukprot:PTQ33007.1 hypothetical protein MARPO_0093s0075 [Marchantia polymorpha]
MSASAEMESTPKARLHRHTHPNECKRSFCVHDHSKDKLNKGRRPTDGRSLNYHHTRKHAKDIEPHYITTISCSRLHDIALNPWHSTNVPGYAIAASTFQLFEHLRESRPNAWQRRTSRAAEDRLFQMMRRRPTGNNSLNYHHSRKHAKDIEPHSFKILKCGRQHHLPTQQWNASYQPDFKAATSVHRLFENIRERKLKPRNRLVKKSSPAATARAPSPEL